MKTKIFHYDNIIGKKIYNKILFLQNTFDKENFVRTRGGWGNFYSAFKIFFNWGDLGVICFPKSFTST